MTLLNASERDLVKHAKYAADQAYAPYSKFKVGASVRLSNGEIIIGNNQENASYPAGLCAEQVALFHVGSNYPDENIEAMVIVTDSNNGTAENPIAPCGICRQVIMEYQNKQSNPIIIYLVNGDGTITKISSPNDLLPMSFSGNFLK